VAKLQTKKVEGLTGNGANGLMELRLAAGLKYHGLYVVRTSGTVAIANFTQIKLLAGSDALYDLSGEQLDELNKEELLTAYDGTTLFIPLDLYGQMKETVASRSTALNVGPRSPASKKAIANAKLQLTISGATAPQFDVYADVSPATAEGPGAIRRIRVYTFTQPAGEAAITTLPVGEAQTALISRIAFKVSAGNLDAGLRINGTNDQGIVEIFHRSKAVNDRALLDGNRLNGAFYDFVADYRTRGILDLLDATRFAQMEFKPNGSATGDVTVVAETLGSL
jgi:hypothetical protein